ncbi:MAG: hypothetical protein HC910_16455 [Spirulinaceae cyanobacterium SM2_1_0]|nr:hypothetical protein [Spirulinaceae cyanobacterium SM2_1_0]
MFLLLGAFLFLLLGVLILLAPLWEYQRAARTAYILCERRAIIIEHNWTAGSFRGAHSVQSFGIDYLRKRILRVGANKKGDIIFEVITHRDSDGDIRLDEKGFKGVSDVEFVDSVCEKIVNRHNKGNAADAPRR